MHPLYQRLVADLAVAAGARHVVDQHRNRHALDPPGGLPGVLQGAVQFAVAGGVLAALARRGGGGRCGLRAGRGVAGRAGNALRTLGGGGVLADLLAAHLLRLAVVQLARFLGHREVHVHADFRIDPAGAGHRLQQLADALVVGGLQAPHLVELRGVHGRVAVRVGDGQHAPALVDHGDPFRRQVRNAGGDHVHDRVDLVALQLLAGAQFQHHRGAGDIALAGEGAGLGNGQVHACVAYRAQGGDGAHQLGFQRVLVTGGFHELADAEAGVALHQLETEPAAVGQAGTGQLEAGVVDVLLRHADRAGGRIQLERDLRGAQQVGRLGGRLLVQAGVQRRHRRLLCPEEHEQAGGHGDADHRHQPQPPGDLQALQPVEPGAGLFRIE